MKIAILEHGSHPDTEFWAGVSQYVDTRKTEFQRRRLQSSSWKDELAFVKQENFDMYLVTPGASFKDHDSAVEIAKFLEKEGHRLLGPSSPVMQQGGPIRLLCTRQEKHQTEFDSQARYFVLALVISGQSIINFEPVTCQQGEIPADVPESALRNNLVAICHSTLKILQPAQQNGLFRLEFRNDSETKQPKLHGIEPQPRIFALDGVGLDDALVRSTVPGGHAALFSFLTILQVSDYGALKEKQQMAEFYADYAVYYDEEMTDEIGYCRHQQIMASQFDWTGTILDVACGTGALGRYLSDGKQDCKIFGIDLSLEMTNTSSIRKYYQLPITIGTMQAAMMQPGEYDHVACFGGLDYLGDDDFRIVLSRMFSVARKSLSFNVEQPTSEYWAKMAENPSVPPSYDHSKKLWDDFQIPVGWELVYDKRDLLYHDNQLDCDIAGRMVRLERL